MRKLLWLDDVRDPFTSDWLKRFAPEFDEQRENIIWVKSYKEFCKYIAENEMPELICFDHDLADRYYDNQTQSEHTIFHEKTGYDCAKWLVDFCMDNEVELPRWRIQSANEVGKENIDKLLRNFLKWRFILEI